LNISQGEVAPFVRTILNVGGGAIIKHGSSAGWETISLSVARVATKLHLGLLSAKADATIKAA
jgi:hypothetical protein